MPQGYTPVPGDDPERDAVVDPSLEIQPRNDEDANCLEKMLFSWATPMIEIGYRRRLEDRDLYPVAAKDKTEYVSALFKKAWAAQMEGSRTWAATLKQSLMTARDFKVTDDHGNRGVVKWIGTLPRANEDWQSIVYAGVEWDECRRRTVRDGLFKKKVIGGDGWYKGEQIFECRDGHGSFIRPHLLTPDDKSAPPCPEPPTVWKALRSAFGWDFAKAGLFKFMNDCLIFVSPICLQLIISFLKSDDPTWTRGLLISFTLLVAQVAQSFSLNQYFFLVNRVGVCMRQALSSAVFDKAMTLSNRTRTKPEFNIGRVTNMMSSDARRAQDVVQSLHQLWSAPFQIVVSCVMLYRLVGVSLFAGVGFMLLLTPIQKTLMARLMKLRSEISQFSDKRVQASTELFTGIRIVKFMVWGTLFRDRVQEKRNQEVDKLRKNQNTRVVMFFFIWLTPVFLSSLTFVVYAVTGGDFSSERIFPAIQLFNILRFPFLILPLQFSMLSQAKVAFDRLALFLSSPDDFEEGTETTPLENDERDYSVIIRNGNFLAYETQPVPPEACVEDGEERLRPRPKVQDGGIQGAVTVGDSSPSPAASPAASPKGKDGPKGKGKKSGLKLEKLEPKLVLQDIDVSIRAGKLTVIIGPTGCGKSCLLSAMLGGLDNTGQCRLSRKGRRVDGVYKGDPVAYAPQQPWIMNGTLKENITFFQAERTDESRYQDAIERCQLGADLDMLQDGDQTEIGEKGINLSGGQKARVSLARTVYAYSDLYFLDDPLSAVDPHVGRALMSEVIGSCKQTKPADWGTAALDGHTRVLVTHQLNFLCHADDILVMKGGRIVRAFYGNAEQTAFDQAMDDDDWDGSDFLSELRLDTIRKQMAAVDGVDVEVDEVVEIKPVAKPAKTPAPPKPAEKETTKLIAAESRAQGSVEWRMYTAYLKAAGGYLLCGIAFLLFCLNQGGLSFADLWLTWWTDSEDSGSSSSGSGSHGTKRPPIGADLGTDAHLLIYIGIVLGTALINLCRGWFVYMRFSTASRNFHYSLLANVVRAPVSFFDSTPLGRLINRFSKDMDQIDTVLPPTIVTFFQLSLQTSAQMAVMISSQPLVLAAFVPASVLYLRILKRFIRTNRETKRLDSIYKSPIYAHFTETLYGISTIKAYQTEENFSKLSRAKMDKNTQTSFANVVCDRWLAIRLELLGNFVCLVMVMLAVVTRMESSSINSSSVGLLSLGITYSLSLTSALNFLVRQCADLEAQMNGVERIVEYTEDIDQEPMLEYRSGGDGDKRITEQTFNMVKRGDQLFKGDGDEFAVVRSVKFPTEGLQLEVPFGENAANVSVPAAAVGGPGAFDRLTVDGLPAGWPQRPDIVFRDVKMRYRQGLELVLKGLNDPATGGALTVMPGDKVGVVGRTGAGKSTLMLALFRFVELAGGSISISGRNIATVNLDDLRRAIAMIPQDPLLFQGTVRSNLVPFQAEQGVEDERIWQALRDVGMEERIRNHDDMLDGAVSDGGTNFSVGQRQLLCLARAILKPSCKILLMDEATASIDHRSDMRIQETVREKFKDYTTLTIAHRLQTIMDSTKVMVLDKGTCVEFDSPASLLSRPTGHFYDMTQKTGDFDRLHRIAKGEIRVVDALDMTARDLLECGPVLLIALAGAFAARATARLSGLGSRGVSGRYHSAGGFSSGGHVATAR